MHAKIPTESSPDVDRIIAAMPKAELHVHLEGAVRPLTFLKLAKRNGLASDFGSIDEASVVELFRFRDFAHFMEVYGASTYVLKQPEDFELVTEELGLDAAAQNVRYMEVTFTAGTHHRFKGMPFLEIMDAIASGAATARRKTGVEMRFIIDHVRGFSLEDCYQTAEWCVAGKKQGVVALGLGGFEQDRPASLYGDAIRWAQAQGVAFVPHAGETVGPEGIWDALNFDPPRIGHGIRSAEDPVLLRHLREQNIVLEVCPTSNVCTGAVATHSSHPLRLLWNAGVSLTLNSDDPHMFNTSVLNEYRVASTKFGFTVEELAAISLTAIQAALLPKARRLELEAMFREEFQRLGIGMVDSLAEED
jgi:adenosine deaminase